MKNQTERDFYEKEAVVVVVAAVVKVICFACLCI